MNTVKKKKLTILFFLYFKQDLDILLPIITTGLERNDTQIQVCATHKVLHRSPRITHEFKSIGIKLIVISRLSILLGIQPNLRTVQVLVTAAESTASPHRWAYILAKRANSLGIQTYTLQHGFENVGLSDADPTYPLSTTRFASQTVFIWGQLSQLSVAVPADTRAKCISVGCPKVAIVNGPKLKIPNQRKYVIAIFENLHWERYTPHYRQRFLTDLVATVKKFPDVFFIIKPHHDGQWLIKHLPETLANQDNVIIANPSDPQWEPFTAPAILQIVDGAITTPSSVAIDAARLQCPVALIQYDLDLSAYAPLPRLCYLLEWSTFIQTIQKTDPLQSLQTALTLFLDLNLKDGDAVNRIFENIIHGTERITQQR